jgi:hypothetical protein
MTWVLILWALKESHRSFMNPLKIKLDQMEFLIINNYKNIRNKIYNLTERWNS